MIDIILFSSTFKRYREERIKSNQRLLICIDTKINIYPRSRTSLSLRGTHKRRRRNRACTRARIFARRSACKYVHRVCTREPRNCERTYMRTRDIIALKLCLRCKKGMATCVNRTIRISVALTSCLFVNRENAETCRLSQLPPLIPAKLQLSLSSLFSSWPSSTTKAGLKSFSKPRNDNGSHSPLKQRAGN